MTDRAMSRVSVVLALLAVALGGLHIAVGFMSNETLTAGALWFGGAGGAVVAGGLANIIEIRASTRDGVARAALLLVNLMLLTMFGLAIPVLNEPPAYIGCLLFAALAALGLARKRSL